MQTLIPPATCPDIERRRRRLQGLRLCFASCLVFAGLAPAAGPVMAQTTKIAAIVNDEAISDTDLENRIKLSIVSSSLQDTPETRQRIEPQVLRSLVDEKLELQEAKRLKVTISQADIDEALGRIAKQNNMQPDQLDGFMAKLGVSRQVLVDQLTASLTWSRLIRRRLAQSVTVSDEEVDDAIAQLKANLNQPRERVSEIFLAVDNPGMEDEIKQTAERLFDQLHAGASFSGVARQFSQSATAANGGDLGWVTPGELPTEVQNVVDQMKPNQLSVPIRSTGGYYLMLLLERRLPAQKSDDDVNVSLDQFVLPLPAGAGNEQQAAVAARARELTNQAKSCGEIAKIGHEQSPQLSGELGRVRVGDLPAQLRPVVLALKVAEPSAPVPVAGGIGVLMVCSREDPASDIPTRDEMTDNLGRQRLETLARRYLRDLRRVAYVDMRA